MPLPKHVIRWYYETQKLLKEQFSIDTMNKGDMGRLHVMDINVLNYRLKTDPPGTVSQKAQEMVKNYIESNHDEELKKTVTENVATEYLPLQPGNTMNSQALPADDVLDGDNNYSMEGKYAFMERKEDGQTYKNDRPEDENEYHTWMLDNQNTFDVKEKDGNLTLISTMSEKEMMRVYDQAADGRLFVNSATELITAQNGGTKFLSVDAEGKPLLLDLSKTKIKQFDRDVIRSFYDKHQDLLDINVDKGKKRQEVNELLICEKTDYSKSNNPKLLYDRVDLGIQTLQRNRFQGDFADEDIDKLPNEFKAKAEAETKAKVFALYDDMFWWEKHEGKPSVSFPDFQKIKNDLPKVLKPLMKTGERPDVLAGGGLDHCFVKKDGKFCPLFPDYQELGRKNDMEKHHEITQRLDQAMKNDGFFFCAKDPKKENSYQTALVSYSAEGDVKVTNPPKAEPAKPWFFDIKKFLNKISKGKLFKEELGDYQKKCSDYQKERDMFATADSLPQELNTFQEKMKPKSMPEEKAEKKEKSLSPEEQARKEKLDKMTPEQQLSYRMAERVLTRLSNDGVPRVFLEAWNKTPEDVQNVETFQNFMKSDTVKNQLNSGKEITDGMVNNMTFAYLDYRASQKVKPAVKEGGEPSKVERNEKQNENKTENKTVASEKQNSQEHKTHTKK